MMSKETGSYFQFLFDIVGGQSRSEFELLLKQLYRIDFYSLVPNDDNREEDGKKLREIFLEVGSHIGSSSLQRKREVESLGVCSVLEMLIGLSYRMENELEGGTNNKKADECFWVLISNLGLTWCNNHGYFQDDGFSAIEEIIGIFLDRKYDRKGVGGLFPLIHTRKDQRKVELWYQMCEYLLENYDF